jgi:centromeric protein E
MENIQVIVRVRPSNPFERVEKDLEIWDIQGGEVISIAADRYQDLVRNRKFLPSQRVEFSFNHCFDQK